MHITKYLGISGKWHKWQRLHWTNRLLQWQSGNGQNQECSGKRSIYF